VSRPRISTRKHLAIWLLLASLVGSIFFSSGIAGSSEVARSAPNAPTNSLVTAWPNDVDTLDPGTVSTDQDKDLTMNIYQRLVEYKFVKQANGTEVWQGLEAQPMLAQSWTVAGPTITFHLRPGVKFYPSGDPLTAQDVKFSFDRIFAIPSGDTGDLQNGGLFGPNQIKVINTSTVQITFENKAGKPATFADSLATMRMPNYGIVDEKAVLKHATKSDPFGANWLKTHTAGTGPYYIASRSLGQQIVLKAVPNLWSGEPDYKTVTIRIVNNGSVAGLMEGGDVNIATFGLSASDISSLSKDGYKVWHVNTPDFIFLMLPVDQGPTESLAVRQAIADAIPYSSIIQTVFDGIGKRSLSYVNLKAPGYIPSWKIYQSNLTKEEALVKASGVGSTPITLTFSNAEPYFEDMAILIKNALAPIGITINLVPVTAAQLATDWFSRGSGAPGSPSPVGNDIVMENVSIYLDDAKSPVDFFSAYGSNYSRYDDPEVNALQTKYQFAQNSTARNAAYEKIQRIVAESASFIPLVITGRTTVTDPNITNLAFSPEIATRYWMLEPKTS
jgi:peptide/nickel transport system substrate-binding protein